MYHSWFIYNRNTDIIIMVMESKRKKKRKEVREKTGTSGIMM